MPQVLATIRKLEAVIAGTFLVLMVVLIFGGGVAHARHAAELDHGFRDLFVRLGVFSLRRHRVAQEQFDVGRHSHRPPATGMADYTAACSITR